MTMWTAAVVRSGRSCLLPNRRLAPLKRVLTVYHDVRLTVSYHCFQNQRFLSDNTPAQNEETADEVVYESPLGKVVRRLRTVSLMTGIFGSIGLPLVVAIKGGDLPSTGMLAVGMTFVAGTLGSTAAIHFVFSPYVFSIERIAVRKCSYKKKTEPESETSSCQSKKDEPVLETKKPRDVMLKAISMTLFLRQRDTVFDPSTDVELYKGLRPMCNLMVKGIPLYVHPEFVYDETLRKELNLDQGNKAKPLKEENPDDIL